MKRICYTTMGILYSFMSFSQIKTEQAATVQKGQETNTWNLNKYLWSYSKYEPGSSNKRILDFDAIDNWQELGRHLSLSNDGKYFAYTIEEGRGLSPEYGKLDSLIVQSTTNSSRRAFVNATPGVFTADNKQYIFQVKDTLWILRLGSKKTTFITNVQSYKLSANGKNGWLVYQHQGNNSSLILRNLTSDREKEFNGVSRYDLDKNDGSLICMVNSEGGGNTTKDLLMYNPASEKEQRYYSVDDYFFANNGKSFLLKTHAKINNAVIRKLEYVTVPDAKAKTIWSSQSEHIYLSDFNWDITGTQVVFSVQDSLDYGNQTEGQIWYYNGKMDSAMVKVSDKTPGIPNGFKIVGTTSFTENGKYIQFSLQLSQGRTEQRPNPSEAHLEIWSYKDMYLSSGKTQIPIKPNTFKAIISTKEQHSILLETEGKTLYKVYGDFAIVKKLSEEIHGERFWEEGYNEDTCWLVSLTDGSRHLLPIKINDDLWFSPTGKYITYFDGTRNFQYFSYNVYTNEEKCISAGISHEFGYIPPYLKNSNTAVMPNGLAAWIQNDGGLLVYGKNDIWLLDLEGKRLPINITNGYGRSNELIFSLFDSKRLYSDNGDFPILKNKEDLLLVAFNTRNKYNGFYHKILGQPGAPKILCSGAYFFNKIRGFHDLSLSNDGREPVKAKDINIWIVQRQSDSDAPNYFLTRDFKSFSRLTNFQPHARFNWLTQELHTYKHLDGKYGQGILFKPENFDSSKKYPVIVVFYGQFSNNLHQFLIPEYDREAIGAGYSPIWFLNNGYLVFTPDIYVSPLKYGPEAFNVIEGAARYLKTLPFVDSNKLGCGSHSWSAKLGAYIFTHSNSFSAMSISEGFLYGNMMSSAFSISDALMGNTRLEATELLFQFGNLWKNKDTWLDQTTILNVDKAKSPLLLLCNRGQDMLHQTLQLYTSLRRLEKKVWWLKYEKGGHFLTDLNEMKDFTVRYMQYFDHYLKDAPPPKWMTDGMDATINGMEASYELNPTGSCTYSKASECPICRAWNEQFKKTPELFQKETKNWVLDKDIAAELDRDINKRRKELDKEGVIRTKEVLQKLNAKSESH